jgi:hypothetical protein
MTFTHPQLLQAARETAEGREFFTSADVRKHLGVSTRDKAKLNAFHTSFRNFIKAAAADVELVGKNRYRVIAQAVAVAAEAPIAAPVVLMSEASDDVGMAVVAEAPASHELVTTTVAKVRGELSVLPAFAARVVHGVTQRPAVQRWRARAQRVSRRVVQLFNGIAIRTRTAA